MSDFPSSDAPRFVFAAAGDHAHNVAAAASLAALAAARTDFYLALGDLSYDRRSVGKEWVWCDFVKSKLGSAYPFELVTGNHEDDGSSQGHILNFAKCLPDRLNATGHYGVQYYFDYRDLARLILISPGLTISGVSYDYVAGDAHYTWLVRAIDDARSGGIPWIIVGMHNTCLGVGGESCEISSDLMDLLIERRVDLVLQAHDHLYARSKQLVCASRDAFVPRCVVDDGSDDIYTKGRGTVFVVAGTFGRAQDNVNPEDPDAGYFVDKFGGNNMNATFGFTRYTVAPGQLSAQFVRSSGGTFSDQFVIVDPGTGKTFAAP